MKGHAAGHTAKPAGLEGFTLKVATLRGLRTAYYDNEKPGADILFFIHGYLDTPESWSAQAAEFGDRYRVILPVGRGIGASEAPADLRRYGAFSILLDHLEILRLADPERKRGVHVIGHDIGGVHSWVLASHPQPSLRSLIIINSVHPMQYLRRVFWPRQVLKSWYVFALQVPHLSEALLTLFHLRVIDGITAEGWRAAGSDIGVREFNAAALNAMNQYRQFVRDIPKFLRDASDPVRAPVLILSSEHDRYLEAPNTLEFSGLASSVTVRVVDGKHWLHREQAERVNRLLLEHWSKC